MRILVGALAVALLCHAGPAFADGSCAYQGNDYLNGSDVCQMGTRYRCQHGVWQRESEPCSLHYALAQASCEYEGQVYAAGRVTCRVDIQQQQRCDGGQWQSIGTPCVASEGLVALSTQARTCLYGGAHFQAQSIMCKEGLTFVCQGGSWVNLQTPCE